MKELRWMSGVKVQVRAKGDGGGLEGYAAVFNSRSEDLGGFFETIKPGAFRRAIQTGQDVRCLFNHDSNSVLGRTKSGTLKLAEDSSGLHFDCELADCPLARNVREMISRGDVDGCSFAFSVPKGCDVWSEDTEGNTLREVHDADLFDVGPVTYPAYRHTSVNARNLWPDGMPMEVRSHRTRESGLVTACYRFRPPIHGQLETLRARLRLQLAQLQ